MALTSLLTKLINKQIIQLKKIQYLIEGFNEFSGSSLLAIFIKKGLNSRSNSSFPCGSHLDFFLGAV